MSLKPKIKLKVAQNRPLKPERIAEIKVLVETPAFIDLVSRAKLSLTRNLPSSLPEYAYYHNLSGNLMIDKFIDKLYEIAENPPDEESSPEEDDS